MVRRNRCTWKLNKHVKNKQMYLNKQEYITHIQYIIEINKLE